MPDNQVAWAGQIIAIIKITTDPSAYPQIT